MNLRKSHIYALLDPSTFAPHYVGRTASSLEKRLSQHLADTKLGRKSSASSWIRSLDEADTRPIIALLETVEGQDWRQAECAWIARLKAEGADLLNRSAGGTGPEGGYRWTERGLERLRRAHAGRSRGGTSVYPGVAMHNQSGRWRAKFCNTWLGVYDTPEEAFLAYLTAYRARFDGDPPGWEGWTPPSDLDGEIGPRGPKPKEF